ncbi:Nuclear receptor-interacting protein 2 [Camelus dromedarius]|uniref:Nuclear receptor-interacting protein 2 n=1 Tax=Camelus dromedarius TaxID=9838 RepID=A0A5N4C5K5_CAMDR|nr:Nuclear receptor-interacting protein 2 [Camelus dromedarius]
MEGRTTAGAMSTRPEAPREEGDSGSGGREAELRGRAQLSQQRWLRQATQFLHKDSADLLPLDSLKRLGTSKDWGPEKVEWLWPLAQARSQALAGSQQPHSVIQRRLVEGTQSHAQGESPLVQALIHGQEGRRRTSKTERPALLVNCKVWKRARSPRWDLAPGPPAQVEQLELQLGQETVACSARVVDVESPELCLGLQTLLALKCCIDLERGVLRLRAPFSELPFLPLHPEPGQ